MDPSSRYPGSVPPIHPFTHSPFPRSRYLVGWRRNPAAQRPRHVARAETPGGPREYSAGDSRHAATASTRRIRIGARVKRRLWISPAASSAAPAELAEARCSPRTRTFRSGLHAAAARAVGPRERGIRSHGSCGFSGPRPADAAYCRMLSGGVPPHPRPSRHPFGPLCR